MIALSCEIEDESCPKDFCSNGGTCVEDTSEITGFKCKCTVSYSGPTCNIALNGCESNPCLPHEICVTNQDGGYTCLCIPGTSSNCMSKYSSLVSPFLAGITKANYLSACSRYPCKNDGVCEAIDLQNYICKCKFGYTGRNCETLDVCLLQPYQCKNGGKNRIW